MLKQAIEATKNTNKNITIILYSYKIGQEHNYYRFVSLNMLKDYSIKTDGGG